MSAETTSTSTAPDAAGLADPYLELLLSGKRHEAGDLILGAAEAGTPVRDIYLKVFQPVQYRLGELWQNNRISVAEEHYCTAATQFIMSRLYGWIFTGERTGQSLVACCVGGELHEIGMRMVSDFFEMEGWDTYYLGASTPDQDVVETLRKREASVLGVSVTMTFNVHLAGTLVEKVRAAPELDHVRILVGGYPFRINPGLSKELGADATARDADSAVKTARDLLGG